MSSLSGKPFRSARAFYRHGLENSVNYNTRHSGVTRIMLERVLMLSSFIISATVLLVALILSVLNPLGKPGDGTIFVVNETNAIYVLLGDTLHPTDSLTNAQLITGTHSKPVKVAYQALNGYPKGTPMGIHGAPFNFTPSKVGLDSFAVCDMTSISGQGIPVTVSIDYLPGAFTEKLVSSPTPIYGVYQQKLYYIVDGSKILVPGDKRILTALNLANTIPVQLSTMLFNFLPLKGVLSYPFIPGEGQHVAYSRYVSGTVITDGKQEYVVTSVGLARIPSPLGEALRNRNSYHQIVIPQVIQDIIVNSPKTSIPTVFPATAPVPVVNPIMCGMWTVDAFGIPHFYSNTYDHIPGNRNDFISTIPSTTSNGWGQAQIIAIRNGSTGFLFHTTPTTGNTLFYVSNTGIRYGVSVDEETVQALELKKNPMILAPDAVIKIIPEGPYLSRKAALVSYTFWK